MGRIFRERWTRGSKGEREGDGDRASEEAEREEERGR